MYTKGASWVETRRREFRTIFDFENHFLRSIAFEGGLLGMLLAGLVLSFFFSPYFAWIPILERDLSFSLLQGLGLNVQSCVTAKGHPGIILRGFENEIVCIYGITPACVFIGYLIVPILLALYFEGWRAFYFRKNESKKTCYESFFATSIIISAIYFLGQLMRIVGMSLAYLALHTLFSFSPQQEYFIAHQLIGSALAYLILLLEGLVIYFNNFRSLAGTSYELKVKRGDEAAEKFSKIVAS